MLSLVQLLGFIRQQMQSKHLGLVWTETGKQAYLTTFYCLSRGVKK